MTDTTRAAPPKSFWIVSAVSLLWNAFGGYLYLAAKLDPQTALASAPAAMQDYIAQMPLWAHVGWSLGIWGSLLGSVLLLLRSRHAVAAFLVSLLGAIASYAAQAQAGVLTPAEPIMILAVIALLLWFSRRSRDRGLLNYSGMR